MTHLRSYTIVIAVLFSVSVFAQEIIPGEGNPLEDQVLDADFANDSLAYEGFNWYLTAGPSFDSNSISGSGGSTTSLDPSTNIFYSTALNWRNKDSAYSYHLRYKHTSAEYRDLPSFTPDLFKYNKDMYSFLTKFRITHSNFYVGIGAYYYTKKLSETLSQPVLVDQKFIGPTLAVGSSGKMSSIFNWEADLFLNLPFYMDEPDVTSGRYNMGIMPEVNLRLVFPYTKLLDLVVGFNFNFDYMKYKGAGTRGTDIAETGMSYAIPFELRFRF